MFSSIVYFFSAVYTKQIPFMFYIWMASMAEMTRRTRSTSSVSGTQTPCTRPTRPLRTTSVTPSRPWWPSKNQERQCERYRWQTATSSSPASSQTYQKGVLDIRHWAGGQKAGHYLPHVMEGRPGTRPERRQTLEERFPRRRRPRPRRPRLHGSWWPLDARRPLAALAPCGSPCEKTC